MRAGTRLMAIAFFFVVVLSEAEIKKSGGRIRGRGEEDGRSFLCRWEL